MTEQFNLDSLFDALENETKLSSTLYYPKKGDSVVLVMLPPVDYQGELKLALPIEGEYNGKKSTQFIMRFVMFNKVNGKPDTTRPHYVGIPLSPTYVQQIVKAYKGEYQLAKQECHMILLDKGDKTVLTFSPTVKRIPAEIWDKGCTLPTWEELLKANADMKANQAAKATGKDAKTDNKEVSPWEA